MIRKKNIEAERVVLQKKNEKQVMGSEWTFANIDDLKANSKGSVSIGPFGSRMKSDCYVDNGIPVIRGTNITGGPNFKGAFVYITEEMADSLGSSNDPPLLYRTQG